MKPIIAGLILLLLLAMLPGVAQGGHGPASGRPSTDDKAPRERPDKSGGMLFGKVLEVKADSYTVAAFFRAAKDAPGRVPDDMAQQAARLGTLLREAEQRLQATRNANEQRRWREQIAQLRGNMDALLSWRQMEHVVTEKDSVALEGVKRDAMATLEVGKRVSLYVRAERGADGRTPTKVILTRDAVQVDDTVAPFVSPFQQVERNIAYYEIVGDVKTVGPLSVQVNDMTVQVETPQQYGVIRKIPLTKADLKAGQRVRIKATREGDAPKLLQVLVFLNVDAPFSLEDHAGGRQYSNANNAVTL